VSGNGDHWQIRLIVLPARCRRHSRGPGSGWSGLLAAACRHHCSESEDKSGLDCIEVGSLPELKHVNHLLHRRGGVPRGAQMIRVSREKISAFVSGFSRLHCMRQVPPIPALQDVLTDA
jgi:hypothetical protein